MQPGKATVVSYLYREENFLVLFGDLRKLVEDLDLHILSLGLDHEPLVREILVDGVTALGLHLASRPVDEHVGWTIRLKKPAINLFFTGSSSTGDLVGRAFLEGEEREDGLFFAQSKREFGSPRSSSIPVSGLDIFGMIEEFYRQSEQKLARFFHHEGYTAFVQALPDGNSEWLLRLRSEELFAMLDDDGPASGKLEYLAEREFRFRCGCDQDKIARVLMGVYGESPDALFAGDDEVEVECPRCAAQLSITLEDYRRALASRD